jgi:hypothetical protein
MKESKKYVVLSVHEDGLVLTLKNKKKVAVLFREVESMEAVKCKLPLIYEGILILFTALYTVVSILYLLPSKLVLIPVALVVFFYIKIKNMKKYGVLLHLKDGGVYEKHEVFERR